MSWGIFLPYWTGWLVEEKGLIITQAASIMSLGLVARGLSTMFLFPYLSRKLSSRVLIQLMAIGTLISVILYIPAESYRSLIVITILLHIFYPVLMPALDSAASFLVLNNELKHYGKSRSWGSIGFVFCGMILTVFISWLGNVVILWGMLIIMLLFVWLMMIACPKTLNVNPTVSNEGLQLLSLFKIKYLPLVFVIVFLLQGQHATYYNYGYLYLQHIEAPIILIGLILNIAVLAEILFFALADKLFHHTSVSQIFIFSGVGSFIRWMLIYLFPSVYVFSFSQIFHAFSFAMAHYAFIKFINKYVPVTKIAVAQGMYSAIALSFSTALLTLFGGQLFEVEPRLAFLGMVVCTIPAIILALYLARKVKVDRQ